MKVPFVKYHGTGNDFILIDQHQRQWLSPKDHETIAALCRRRFGIGADGLILLQAHEQYDFEMIYFNADGQTSTMCGNGGRCIVAFAERLGIVKEGQCRFAAVDGVHEARIRSDGIVELRMGDVHQIEQWAEDACVLDTGSPHYVQFVREVAQLDVVQAGRRVRYSEPFAREGINVNFAQAKSDHHLVVATYERGVEDETWSCGTGVTAAALAWAARHPQVGNSIKVHTKGGLLEVRFQRKSSGFSNVWLCGPATYVFSGEVEV